MTTAADLADLVLEMAPLGGSLCFCAADGTPLLGPGNPPSMAVPAVLLAEAELPHLVRIRFGASAGAATPGATLSTYTTDPWVRLPSGAWVLPSLSAEGQLQTWLRFVPTALPVPLIQEPVPT